MAVFGKTGITITGNMLHKYIMSGMLMEPVAKNLIEPDMGRAETWLNLLASGVTSGSKKFDSNNRPVLF